jgi:Tetratricopeptide repeat
MIEFASSPFACTRSGWLLVRLSVILFSLGVLLASPVGYSQTVYSSKTYTGTNADLPQNDATGTPGNEQNSGAIIQLIPEKPEAVPIPPSETPKPTNNSNDSSTATPLNPMIAPSKPLIVVPATTANENVANKNQDEPSNKREMSAEESAFFAAVQSYRKGDYTAARQAFSDFHRQNPDDVRAVYYLAMTEAQLGNFKQAERSYKEVIRREPDGKISLLAREGLKALPTEATLDSPPRFPTENTAPTAHGNAATISSPLGNTSPSALGTPVPAGMSSQDWMMLQMMMSGAGNTNGMGGNSGGGNWGMMAPMMMMQPSANGGAPNIDPEVMKTILMNQMMQGFDLNPTKDKD